MESKLISDFRKVLPKIRNYLWQYAINVYKYKPSEEQGRDDYFIAFGPIVFDVRVHKNHYTITFIDKRNRQNIIRDTFDVSNANNLFDIIVDLLDYNVIA